MTDEETIDGALGDGSYDDWNSAMMAANDELDEIDATQKKYRDLDIGMMSFDIDLLKYVSYEYDQALQNILEQFESGSKWDDSIEEEIRENYATLLKAIELVKSDNNILDAKIGFGYIDLSIFIVLGLLAGKIAATKKAIEELKDQLKDAQKEYEDDRNSLVINTLLDVAETIFPELEAGAEMVDMLKKSRDYLLGKEPSGRDTALEAGAKLSETLEKVKGLSEETKSIAKDGGEAIKVVGVYFDVDETFSAYDKVQALKAAVAAANNSYKALNTYIEQNLPAIHGFEYTVSLAKRKAAPLYDANTQLRNDLNEFIRNNTAYRVSVGNKSYANF